jgi:hypothetical protein
LISITQNAERAVIMGNLPLVRSVDEARELERGEVASEVGGPIRPGNVRRR